MELFIYEKDFTREPLPEPEEPSWLLKFLEDSELSEKPYMKPRKEIYVVNEEIKKNFEELLPLCEKFAEKEGGHIRASIDHDNHDAYIVISGLRYFEFNLEDERQFLSEIAMRSTGVTFLLGDDRETLTLSIYFPYYRPVVSKEEENQRALDLYNGIKDMLELLSE